MLSLTFTPSAKGRRRLLLGALSAVLLLPLSGQARQAASFALDADPTYSFGASTPDVFAMAAAIQFRMGIAVSVVTTLPNEDTAFAPVMADSQAAPFHIFGPSAGGVIKDLNINSPLVTGVTRADLRSDGLESDFCGDTVERFVLRVYTTTQFYDVLVRYATCSGMANVLWSFYQISAARPIEPTPSTSPTPPPVQLTSTVSRKTHGMAGTFDVNLPFLGPPGIECRRTTNASGDYTIVYTFSNPLNSVSSASVTSGIGRVHDSDIGPAPNQYFVNLVNVANAQDIVVSLNFVQDSAGNASPVVNATMSVLIGDVTANGNVGRTDVTQVKGQQGHAVTMFNFRDDVNHDGLIDGTDVSIVQNKKGTSLPP